MNCFIATKTAKLIFRKSKLIIKLKLEKEYSNLKLWSVCNIQYELNSFYFVFVNFASFDLFNVIIGLVCYFRLLKFTLRKNKLNIVYASDSIQQERLPVSLEVGRIPF